MILSVGEILADMVGVKKDGQTVFNAFCGGAPFNLAVNAKRAGAKVGFVGRVGDDPVGRFVASEAKKADLDFLCVQTDKIRNTTIAFVTLTDGERDFAFYRHDTADFNINFDDIPFDTFSGLSTIHLGSLMLSEKRGVAFAEKIADKAEKLGVTLSFDMNFRMDIYDGLSSAKRAYAPFVEMADVIKFSDDELTAYTGIDNLDAAATSIAKEGKLVVVTMGSRGSAYFYNGESGKAAVKKVKPVDTTGAGDAFFGAFLANIDGKKLDKKTIETALAAGNVAGAAATQFMGAIRL